MTNQTLNNAEIARRYLAGELVEDIAKSYAVHAGTIQYRLKVMGIVMRGHFMDLETRRKMHAMFMADIHNKVIARELGISTRMVQKHKKVWDHKEVLADLLATVERIKANSKETNTSKLDKQIEALKAVLS